MPTPASGSRQSRLLASPDIGRAAPHERRLSTTRAAEPDPLLTLAISVAKRQVPEFIGHLHVDFTNHEGDSFPGQNHTILLKLTTQISTSLRDLPCLHHFFSEPAGPIGCQFAVS